jgi:hypothetical protein
MAACSMYYSDSSVVVQSEIDLFGVVVVAAAAAVVSQTLHHEGLAMMIINYVPPTINHNSFGFDCQSSEYWLSWLC